MSSHLRYPILVFLVATAFSACDGGNDRSLGDTDSFRVALLTPGSVSDQSWNSGAYAGLPRIRDSLGAVISHIETRIPAEFEENFRQYGAQGFDLVFGHGFEFQDAASRFGPDYPATVYITSSGNRVGANVAPMVSGFQDASYLAGVLAAHLSRTGVLGVIGGQEIPPVRNSFEAFEAGARSVRPDLRLLTSYIGNWDDASAGREQLLAQIGRGADIIFQNADAAGFGVFQAARQSPGVLAFGANSDQNHIAPDVIIGSVVIDLPHAFLEVAREVRDGRFEPRMLHLGTREGVVRLVLNPELADHITTDARAALDSVERGIAEQRIRPPRLEYAGGVAGGH